MYDTIDTGMDEEKREYPDKDKDGK